LLFLPSGNTPAGNSPDESLNSLGGRGIARLTGGARIAKRTGNARKKQPSYIQSFLAMPLENA